MFAFGSVAFVAFLLHSFLLCLPVCAIPFDARQANDRPQTVTSINTANSPMGTVIETCVIVLTPVKDAEGNEVVQEVKTCTLEINGNRSSASSSVTTATSTTSLVNPTTKTETLPVALSTSSPVSSSTSITTSTPIPIDPTEATDPIDPTGSTNPTIEPTPRSSSLPASIAAAGGASMPGKSMSVLPIGLGVFAGISVVALIVVGLVTYERTKYRKAFRQRKLAETGAAMGYGGMNY